MLILFPSQLLTSCLGESLCCELAEPLAIDWALCLPTGVASMEIIIRAELGVVCTRTRLAFCNGLPFCDGFAPCNGFTFCTGVAFCAGYESRTGQIVAPGGAWLVKRWERTRLTACVWLRDRLPI